MNNMLIEQIGILEAMILIDGFIWCVAGNFNVLLKINVNTGKINYIAEIPEEKICKQRLYSDIQQYRHKLIFVPMAADNITIYDMQSEKFTKIKLKKPTKKNSLYKEDYKFSKCVIYNSNAYLFNVSYPAIIKLNLDNYTIDYIDEWINCFNLSKKNKEKVYFRNIYREQDCIYLASCCGNIVIKFELENEKISVHKVGKDSEIFSDIVVDENRAYISLLSENKVIVFNKKNWTEIGRIILEKGMSVSIEMKKWNNKIFYFPLHMTEILVIENETVKNKIILHEDYNQCNVFKVINNQEKCYFISERNKYLMIFFMDCYEIKKVQLCIDDKLRNYLIKMNNLINEYFIDIQAWIDSIKKNTIDKDENIHLFIGSKIWTNIRSNI